MKVAFLTLGCKVNFYETEKMEADFEANHVTVVPFKEKADVYIVNTCTVTNIADRKSRQMLHRARRLRRGVMRKAGKHSWKTMTPSMWYLPIVTKHRSLRRF